MLICARWYSPIRVRSTMPNAALSHATAARTSGYESTGTTLAGGTDLLGFIYGSLMRLLAALVAADAVTTQRGLNQGLREANPLMRPFVTHGAAGEAAGSALGFGAGVGVVYLLHRSHHYKAERITMRIIVAGEGAFVANNIIAIR